MFGVFRARLGEALLNVYFLFSVDAQHTTRACTVQYVIAEYSHWVLLVLYTRGASSSGTSSALALIFEFVVSELFPKQIEPTYCSLTNSGTFIAILIYVNGAAHMQKEAPACMCISNTNHRWLQVSNFKIE